MYAFCFIVITAMQLIGSKHMFKYILHIHEERLENIFREL